MQKEARGPKFIEGGDEYNKNLLLLVVHAYSWHGVLLGACVWLFTSSAVREERGQSSTVSLQSLHRRNIIHQRVLDVICWM